MADWIKMRVGLPKNPKVIRGARVLDNDPEYIASIRGPAVTGTVTSASQFVTFASVMRDFISGCLPLWGALNDDIDGDFVPGATLFEVDQMSGIPGFGRALEAVGWVQVDAERGGLTFPNFHEHNIPGKSRPGKTPAERAREYRERKRHENVTDRHVTSRDARHATRQDIQDRTESTSNDAPPKAKRATSTPTNVNEEHVQALYQAYPKKVGKPAALRAIRKALASQPFEMLLDAVREYAECHVGRDQFVKAPAGWFGDERWNDDRSAWRQASPSSRQNVFATSMDVLGKFVNEEPKTEGSMICR